MELRAKCITTMQAAEYTVEHSVSVFEQKKKDNLLNFHAVYTLCYDFLNQWQIIPLLSKAINHFKSHRSERMIALLKVLLAEEYYHVRQYNNALT